MNAPTRENRERKRLAAGHRAALLLSGMEKARVENFLYIEEIHLRAETITPLLKNILTFEPRPSWNP